MNPEKVKDFENLTEGAARGAEENDQLDRNKRQEVKNETEVAEEERKLQIFSDAIGDPEYYIGGGIGVELAEGALKHRHGDMDIIVFEDDIEEIKKNLESKGFTVTKGESFGGHTLDARNFEIDEESDEPSGEGALHIGIFVYKRNKEKEMAQQLDEDGDISKEFPLSYFDKEKQFIDHKGNKLIVADLRLSVGFKIASDREKDIKDIERVKSLLKSRYSKEEIEELKEITMKNIETLFNASIKHTFLDFLKTNTEITGENIYKYFDADFKEKIAGLEDVDYANTIKEFVVNLKDFSSSTKEYKQIKKEFLAFASDKLKPVADYYKKRVDKSLN